MSDTPLSPEPALPEHRTKERETAATRPDVDPAPPLTGLPATIAALWDKRPLWVRRLGALVHVLRIRLAHAVLLPELTPDQAYDLRQIVRKEGQLSNGYILMCALAAGIATLGLLQSSTAVVIGAMLVSPLMSPIAALGFGFASLDGHRIRDAVKVVAVGALIGIVTGIVLTLLSPIRNATPEILARTEPNLLDLAVALFSGIAGGYSTVIGKGGTAIGVAIATALMPPLSVIGYGIGVLQPMFAMGALLLFLTNLAAITLAFALIARMSGAARPLGKVEWTPRYIGILVAAFLALATPLSMTLMKLTSEARVRLAARDAIIEACGGSGVTIAQLDVKSSVFGQPSVDALVIATSYTANAENKTEDRLMKTLGDEVQVSLQQVVAADVQSQTKAMVDAAMERTTAGIAADVPPFKAIRRKIGLPTRSLWTDRAQRIVYVDPSPAPEWSLADYQAIEQVASEGVTGWSVRVIPPPQASLSVMLDTVPADKRPAGAISADLAIWALQRWGMGDVSVSGADQQKLAPLVKMLGDAGISAQLTMTLADAENGRVNRDAEGASTAPATATIRVYAPSPLRQAAERAARKAAEDAARAAKSPGVAPAP